MFSLRNTLATRQLPAGYDLSEGIGPLCGPRPVSITSLRSLPPQTVIFNANELGAQNITVSAQLAMNADDFWLFTGHAHEGGFAGGNYAYGLILDFKDTLGNVVAFSQQGSLDGQSDPFGNHDDKWTQNGQNSLLADNWIAVSTAGIHYNLVASTDVIHVLEAVFASLLALAAAIGFLFFATDKKTTCKLQPTPDGSGVELVCTRPID